MFNYSIMLKMLKEAREREAEEKKKEIELKYPKTIAMIKKLEKHYEKIGKLYGDDREMIDKPKEGFRITFNNYLGE